MDLHFDHTTVCCDFDFAGVHSLRIHFMLNGIFMQDKLQRSLCPEIIGFLPCLTAPRSMSLACGKCMIGGQRAYMRAEQFNVEK
jgi:hypothetical protein